MNLIALIVGELRFTVWFAYFFVIIGFVWFQNER